MKPVLEEKQRWKKCLGCKKDFRKPGIYSIKQWSIAKYCSSECSIKYFFSLRQKILWNKNSYKEMMSKNHKGIKKEFSYARSNPTQYSNLHSWVYKTLGRPMICKNCKKEVKEGSKIHWANISRNYKKDINDWIRLCSNCHVKYDYNKLILSL